RSDGWSADLRGDRGRFHRDAVAGCGRHLIPAADHAHRVDEVLVQVIDVLDHPTIQPRAHPEVVEHRQVLHVLAKSHTTGVRADGYPELRGHQQDRDHLVNTRDPAGIDLAHLDGPGL